MGFYENQNAAKYLGAYIRPEAGKHYWGASISECKSRCKQVNEMCLPLNQLLAGSTSMRSQFWDFQLKWPPCPWHN